MKKIKEEFYHEDGLLNVAEGIIRQTRMDYIKGAKYMFRIYGCIPTEKEAMEKGTLYKRAIASSSGRDRVRWFYDSWKFFKNDPYEMFFSVDKKEVFKEWNTEAIFLYYLDVYRPYAEKIYVKYENFCPSEDKISELLGEETELYNLAKDKITEYFREKDTSFEDGIYDYHERIEQKIKREKRRKKKNARV